MQKKAYFQVECIKIALCNKITAAIRRGYMEIIRIGLQYQNLWKPQQFENGNRFVALSLASFVFEYIALRLWPTKALLTNLLVCHFLKWPKMFYSMDIHHKISYGSYRNQGAIRDVEVC